MTARSGITHLDELIFDNRFVHELPGDQELSNTRRQVEGACYSRVSPTPVAAPKLVAYSREVAELLDLEAEVFESADFTQVFSGNRLSAGMEPYAMCYGGHQFGNWAGQLGDGRAINLGEVINRQGQRWVLQLKGAGLTPYSRTADGLAVLRSSVREFLCSEAMHHLGVPTTRALSLITTGEQVLRDMFYNGNSKLEPGAVVCRVAPSFTRFGNFQILAARGNVDLLKKLVDYTIRTDFPHLGEPSPTVYLSWFEEVCRRTAQMIVHWQRVGFVHGVMNTDNMSILGLTIDYGPYGWLENYDPGWTPNTTDANGRRYRFGNQPQIAFWNLGQLANAIYSLVGSPEPLQQAMNSYVLAFEQGWQAMMTGKLGLDEFDAKTDDQLIDELQTLLRDVETDMTIFYRRLALVEMNAELADEVLMAPLLAAFYVQEQLTEQYKTRLGNWIRQYIKRAQCNETTDENRRQRMNATNPKYVLRNYLAQLAIDQAEQGDYSLVNELLEVLRRPYDEQPDNEKYAEKRPDWARQRAGCSMLSCSS
ncbi:MAG: YdiU family protein [Methylococcaceae bacterium]|nr:YdiU family protein [Methylococcaceae bacterium]MDZ4157175.1 YdiU family protein [Methylococcales bacterium]MDP2394865.1 YdiU family protein [Methylococcaceae bacterium]MDP3020286.1 YdiU family protein [Methylococcaceae bacterium]MDP3390827.1 YdiU family protein [Methylococcaceae bacterium]